MKIYSEINLCNFEPWSGAVETFNRIWNEDKMDELEAILVDLYPEGIDETGLNDLFWFEEEWLFDMLGIVDDDDEEDDED